MNVLWNNWTRQSSKEDTTMYDLSSLCRNEFWNIWANDLFSLEGMRWWKMDIEEYDKYVLDVKNTIISNMFFIMFGLMVCLFVVTMSALLKTLLKKTSLL